MKYLHDLKIQYLPVTGVKPDPRNARTHSKKQIGQIASSITVFGFANPLLVDEDGVLIAGHGRLAAAKRLTLEQVPVIELKGLGDAPHFNAVELGKNGRNRTNVWDYASVNSLRGSRREDLALHPTVKPVGLVSDAICDVTRHGELVLDTFLGSGTTLIAAERTGRRFAGCDIDPAYVDVALERWSSLTGQEPVRVLDREAA